MIHAQQQHTSTQEANGSYHGDISSPAITRAISNELLLLHHLLMYSNTPILTHYAKLVEEEIKHKGVSVERVALIGVYFLRGDTTNAHRILEEIQSLLATGSDHDTNNNNNEECEWMIQALDLWLHGDIPKALQYHEQLFHKYPNNLWNLTFTYQQTILLYEMKWFLDQLEKYVIPAFISLEQAQQQQQQQEHESQQKPQQQILHYNTQHFGHYVKGMYCFALEEMGHLERAEVEGIDSQNRFDSFVASLQQQQQQEEEHKSDNIDPTIFKNPWTHHSMAHVYHTTGRYDEGIAYLWKHAPTWHSCDAFMETHNYWHLALLYLARNHEGDVQQACKLLVEHMWIDHSTYERGRDESSEWKHDPSTQYGAVNFLWKLDQKCFREDPDKFHLFDTSMEHVWDEVTHYSQHFLHKHLIPFLDLHYTYLTARNYALKKVSDQEVQEYLRGMCDKSSDLIHGHIYKHMVIPVTNGILSYTQGQFQYAYTILKNILEQEPSPDVIGTPSFRHNSIGGSLLQREVLDVLWDILKQADEEQHHVSGAA